jgi:leukotriene-A4 hydrolase
VETPAGRRFAQHVFDRARAGYHPITTATVTATLAKAAQPAPVPAP